MIPNLQNPKNPLPYDPMKLPPTVHVGDQAARPSGFVLTGGRLVTAPALPNAHGVKVTRN